MTKKIEAIHVTAIRKNPWKFEKMSLNSFWDMISCQEQKQTLTGIVAKLFPPIAGDMMTAVLQYAALNLVFTVIQTYLSGRLSVWGTVVGRAMVVVCGWFVFGEPRCVGREEYVACKGAPPRRPGCPDGDLAAESAVTAGAGAGDELSLSRKIYI